MIIHLVVVEIGSAALGLLLARYMQNRPQTNPQTVAIRTLLADNIAHLLIDVDAPLIAGISGFPEKWQ